MGQRQSVRAGNMGNRLPKLSCHCVIPMHLAATRFHAWRLDHHLYHLLPNQAHPFAATAFWWQNERACENRSGHAVPLLHDLKFV